MYNPVHSSGRSNFSFAKISLEIGFVNSALEKDTDFSTAWEFSLSGTKVHPLKVGVQAKQERELALLGSTN
jgi:hypothetical protein